jgi:aminoglycoside phosphotransferase (APT) family kinase protein
VNDFGAALAHRATDAAQRWRPGSVVDDIRPLTGGMSSLTFSATVRGAATASADIVLKVAPPGLEPVRNRDVLRQATLLRALHGRAGLSVPAALFEDAGHPPEVPPFVAMPLVAGECFEPLLEPRDAAPPTEMIRSRAFEAVRMLAAMHRLMPAEIGLGAEPIVTLPDEIDRWNRVFAVVPADLRGEHERCARRLHATTPEALPPAVIHGDYRLGNILCDGGHVEAIIDWEIWAVSDPRIDLSWLSFFTDEARHPAASSSQPCGMPTFAELVQSYETERGQAVADLDWFVALTRFKEAAATALLIKRGRKAESMPAALRAMENELPGLVAEALEILGG